MMNLNRKIRLRITAYQQNKCIVQSFLHTNIFEFDIYIYTELIHSKSQITLGSMLKVNTEVYIHYIHN